MTQPPTAPSAEYEVIADLVNEGSEVIVALGGGGGRGNAAARALPGRPAPATSDPPQPGEISKLALELKLLADIALVGLPNVGKSSLLRALSSATPRVADFAFTTLHPQLGSLKRRDPGRPPIIVADVPGLIEGAHSNRGLGLRFLRHVERTAALAFVVDASGSSFSSVGLLAGRGRGAAVGDWPAPGAPSCGGGAFLSSTKERILAPKEQIALLRSEIGHYSCELLQRPWMVVVNKIDLLSRPNAALRALERDLEKQGNAGVKVVGVSATGGGGTEDDGPPFDNGGGDSGKRRSIGGKPRGIDELVDELARLLESRVKILGGK